MFLNVIRSLMPITHNSEWQYDEFSNLYAGYTSSVSTLSST